ncbi:hypothetical protein ACA910_016796 [Epithemia clementina (nom. ined.)]
MAKRKRSSEFDATSVASDSNVNGSLEDSSTWSKSKRTRMRRLKAKQRIIQNERASNKTQRAGEIVCDEQDRGRSKKLKAQPKGLTGSYTISFGSPDEADKYTNSSNKKPSSSSLIESFKARLSGSRFRTLNEELYTTTSHESFERFTKEPQLFEDYHDGFRHQVSAWPVNPVSVILKRIRKQQQIEGSNGAGNKLVVADFGCGDAQLAQELLDVPEADRYVSTHSDKEKKRKRQGETQTLSLKNPLENNSFRVHSFDLVQPKNSATKHLVTPCDMANVPLKSASVDVGVFCLSLMGTNLADFVREAHRVLKPQGCLWIAEVQSRFSESFSPNDEKTSSKTYHNRKTKNSKKQLLGAKHSGLEDFLKVLGDLGFRCIEKDLSNKMFFLLRLVKSGKKPKQDVQYTAKACIYKRR